MNRHLRRRLIYTLSGSTIKISSYEMYVARRRLFNKEGKPDQSGYHLVVLAKNEKGYHNLAHQLLI